MGQFGKIVSSDIFETRAAIMKETDSEIKYQMRCDTQNGFMHCYHLFPGIDLAYSTFEAFSCRMRNKAMPNILEIVAQGGLSANISVGMSHT